MDGFNFWEKLEINIFDGLNREREKIEVGDDSSAQSKLSVLPLERPVIDSLYIFIYVFPLFF